MTINHPPSETNEKMKFRSPEDGPYAPIVSQIIDTWVNPDDPHTTVHPQRFSVHTDTFLGIRADYGSCGKILLDSPEFKWLRKKGSVAELILEIMSSAREAVSMKTDVLRYVRAVAVHRYQDLLNEFRVPEEAK